MNRSPNNKQLKGAQLCKQPVLVGAEQDGLYLGNANALIPMFCLKRKPHAHFSFTQ